MPISDQVIELETKKTGRNIVFIVLIAVLAAASVVFAVLWATKESAVPPPSISAVHVQSTDMFKQASADENGVPTYVVVPSQSYTMRFDVVLDEKTDLSQVNALLNVETRPAGMIEVTAGGGVPEDNKGQYVLNFTVLSHATEQFTLVVSSQYSPDVTQEYNVVVSRNAYVEYFDIESGVHGKTLNGNTDGSATLLQLSDTSTATTLHYTLSESLPFYEDSLKPNQYYNLPFVQLGAMDGEGHRMKIMQGVQTAAGWFDQVQVFVADKSFAAAVDADYKEITTDLRPSENLSVWLNMGQDYCNSFVRFRASKEGTSTIKLVANAFNDAPQKYEIYVQVSFVSSNSYGEITKIQFYNPYNPDRYAKKDTVKEIDMYLGNYTPQTMFPLSDYIQVVCGKKDGADVVDEDPEWGTYALRGYVSDDAGNTTRNSILTAIDTNNGFAIAPAISAMSGTAYVTVRDYSPTGFSTSLTIKVNIHPTIEKITPNKEQVNMFAGNKDIGGNTAVHITYTLGSTVNNDDTRLMQNLNSEFIVRYPQPHEVPSARDAAQEPVKPEYNYALPVWGSAATPTNAADTIYVEGMTADKGVYRYVPKRNEDSLVSEPFKFFVGENVKTGDYTLEFVLTPQGFDTKDNTVADSLRFSVTITVTRAATGMGVNENAAFDPCDSHTVVKKTGDTTATVTIAIGTGVTVGNNNFTRFALKDILVYYYHDLEFKDVGDVIYDSLSITMGKNALITQVFNDDKQFLVPSNPTTNTYEVHIKLSDDFTLYLTVEYKLPVEQIVVTQSEQTVYYTLNGGSVNVTSYFRALSRKGDVNARIDAENMLKYPEKLHADVVIMANDADIVLTKKSGAREEVTEYYWDDVHVFTLTRKSDLTYTIALQKDLFAWSLAENKDLQTVRVYYSYGDNVNIFGVSDFVAYTEYSFARQFDDVYVCDADKDVTDPLATRNGGVKKALTDVVSGVTYTLHVAGVVYRDGNSADATYIWDNDCAYACSTIVAQYAAGLNLASIVAVPNGTVGQFRAVCVEGKNQGFGTVIFQEQAGGVQQGASVVLDLTVNNTATEVANVTLASDDALLLYRHRNDSTVTLRYTVTYAPHTSQDTGLGNFELDMDSGLAVKSGNTTWSFFDKSPSELESSGEYGTYGLRLEGVGADKHFVYDGVITLCASDVAQNATYAFGVTGGTYSARENVRVTTAIADDTYRFLQTWNANKEVSLVAAKPDLSAIDALHFAYADSADPAENAYIFTIAAGNVDLANLQYDAKFVDSSGADITNAVKGVQLLFIKDNNNRYEQSFRLLLTGYTVDGKLLQVTVTETIGTQVNTYYLFYYITVRVPVQTLAMRVGDVVLDGNENNTFVVTTKGTQTPQTFDLEAIVNNGDADRAPAAVSTAFTLENLQGATADRIRIENGKLHIADTVTDASFVLTLTATADGLTRTLEITMAVNTDILTIAFQNASLAGSTVTDNNEIDFTAIVKNAGTGEVQDVAVEYACTAQNGITVDGNGAKFTPHGGNGSFTVTATYGAYTASATVTVKVAVKGVQVSRGETVLTSGNRVTVVAGQTQDCEFNVKAISAIAGVDPADTAIGTITYSADGIATLSLQGGKYVLTAHKAGETAITVPAAGGGDAFVLNVKVLASALTVAFEGTQSGAFNVFGGNALFGFHVLLPDGNETADATVTVSAESGSYSAGLISVTTLNGSYSVVLDKQKLQSADLQKYTITATYTVNGVQCAGTLEFALKASEEYSPQLALTLVQSELGATDTIDKARGAATYSFRLGGVPVGFAEAATVRFVSDELTLGEAVVTGSTATVAVIALRSETLVSGKVTAEVSLLGNTYTKEMTFTVSDSAEITGALYYNKQSLASVTSLLGADGKLDESNFNQKPDDIGYAADTSDNYVLFVVDYTGIPSAGKATAETFHTTVTGTARVTEILSGIAHAAGKENYYYIAQYRVDTAGSVRFDLYTSVLGGTAYAVEGKTTAFTATAPAFALSGDRLTLDPGASAVVTLTRNAFAGNVEYAIGEGTDADLITLTESKDNDKISVTVAAAYGAGGDTAIALTATVTSGMFKGEVYHYSVPVTVRTYERPVLTVSRDSIWLAGGGESVDIRQYISFTHDVKDTDFAIVVQVQPLGIGANEGSMEGTVFTAGNASPYNGLSISVQFSVAVTGGFYKDTVYLSDRSVRIIASPDVSFASADETVAPDETLDVTLGSRNGATVSAATYSLQPANAGTVAYADGKYSFIPAQGFDGEVTVTAVPTVLYSGHTGEAKPVTRTFTVNKLTIDVTAETLGDTVKYTGVAGVTVTWAFEERSGCDLITWTHDGNGTFTVTKKANTVGGTASYALIATMKNGMQKVFAYTLNVKGADKPTQDNLHVTATNDVSTTPVTGGKIEADIVNINGYAVTAQDFRVSADDAAYIRIDENGNYVFLKKDDSERQITVTVTVTVSGAPYDGLTLAKEVTVYVPARRVDSKPVLADGDITIDITAAANDGLYCGHFVQSAAVAQKGISVLAYVPHGAGIVMQSDGKFTFTAGAGDVSVTVLYSITRGDYAGETASGVIKVHIPALPEGIATVDGTNIAASLKGVSYGTVSYSCDSEYLQMSPTGNNGAWTYSFTEGVGTRTVEITFTATVTDANSVYRNYPVSWTLALQADEPVPVLTYDAANARVLLGGMGDAPYTATYTSDDETYVTMNDNTCVFTDAAYENSGAVTVTATITVSDGVYAGNVYTATVTVRWTVQSVAMVSTGAASGTYPTKTYSPIVSSSVGYATLRVSAVVANSSGGTINVTENGDTISVGYNASGTVTYKIVSYKTDDTSITYLTEVSVTVRYNGN